MAEHIGKIGRRSCLTVLTFAVSLVASGALEAQRLAPVGARRVLEVAVSRQSVLPSASSVRQNAIDTQAVDRTRHAVVGAAIGAVVGFALGYYRGKAEDAACGNDCGGPRIARLVYPPFFGIVGGAIGAVVGYVFPP